MDALHVSAVVLRNMKDSIACSKLKLTSDIASCIPVLTVDMDIYSGEHLSSYVSIKIYSTPRCNCVLYA